MRNDKKSLYLFRCDIEQSEGCVMRILQMIEHRGHQLQTLIVLPVENTGLFSITASIRSDKNVASLPKQAMRLIGVKIAVCQAHGDSIQPEACSG